MPAGREFFAFVKNMTKDGGFYWVLAHITPDFDAHGRIIGGSSWSSIPGIRHHGRHGSTDLRHK